LISFSVKYRSETLYIRHQFITYGGLNRQNSSTEKRERYGHLALLCYNVY